MSDIWQQITLRQRITHQIAPNNPWVMAFFDGGSSWRELPLNILGKVIQLGDELLGHLFFQKKQWDADAYVYIP